MLLIFGGERGSENSGTARGRAISPRVSLHAREDYADLYIYHSSLKNYSRVVFSPEENFARGFRPHQRQTRDNLLLLVSSFPLPSPSFSFFLKKRWKIFHPRLRTVRGPAPSGLTEKCIKGEGDIRKVYMPVVPSLFRLFNDILHGQHFYDAYGLRIKVIVVTLLLLTFDFDIDFSFTLYTYVRVCLPKKRMPKEIWRKVSLHEWSWILYIRFGIKQRQHRVPEKIAFSQETGGNRVEGWKLGQRQFLGETISRNEMRKRFVRNDLET